MRKQYYVQKNIFKWLYVTQVFTNPMKNVLTMANIDSLTPYTNSNFGCNCHIQILAPKI